MTYERIGGGGCVFHFLAFTILKTTYKRVLKWISKEEINLKE